MTFSTVAVVKETTCGLIPFQTGRRRRRHRRLCHQICIFLQLSDNNGVLGKRWSFFMKMFCR